MKRFHLMQKFLLLQIALFLAFAAMAQKQPLRTSDMTKMITAGSLAISPSGSKAISVVNTMLENDKNEWVYSSNLWLLDLNGSTPPKQLTFGIRSDNSPTWSPDGKNIAFSRSGQIWILPTEGGEAWQLTEKKGGAFGAQWSPDGKSILFSSSVSIYDLEGAPEWDYERPARNYGDEPNYRSQNEASKNIKANPDGNLEEIRAWMAKNAADRNPRVVNRLNFLGELDLSPDLSFSHIYLIPFEKGAQEKALTSGFQSYGGAAWSPDGKTIICNSLKSEEHPDRTTDSDLYSIDVASGAIRLFLDWDGYNTGGANFSPDGKQILFSASPLNDPGYGYRNLAIISATGGSPRWLTADLDYNLFSGQWSKDGRYIYFSTGEKGANPLFRIPSAGGKPETLIGSPNGVRDFDIWNDKLVFALTKVENPWEVYTSDLTGKNIKQISRFNESWLAERIVQIPKEYWVESSKDGRKIQYWVMEPVGKKDGIKYPTILNIHGGPSAMWGPGEFSMWFEFQLMTSWGYGLVFGNPRGSSGYGYDFQKANYQDWGHGPTADLMSALDQAAQNHSWIDTDQYFITGGSYAGYLTAWIISQEHRFKAAVAQRGVYDIAFFFGEGNAWRLVPNHFGGYPWEPEFRKIMDEQSPTTFAHQIQTPLLIKHADTDLRTGVRQSELLYKALKVMGKEVEYIRYPGEGHELSRAGNILRRMDRLMRIIEFFERYVEHPEPAPAAN
jgi:dipeptidyl aminopeptidase/acylaminoacyl peptidase